MTQQQMEMGFRRKPICVVWCRLPNEWSAVYNRGVVLVHVIGKLYSLIVCYRILKWFVPGQVYKVRDGRSTADVMFVLHVISARI